MFSLQSLAKTINPWGTTGMPRVQSDSDNEIPLPAMNGVELNKAQTEASGSPIAEGVQAMREALFAHLADAPSASSASAPSAGIDPAMNGIPTSNATGRLSTLSGNRGGRAVQDDGDFGPPVFNPTIPLAF